MGIPVGEFDSKLDQGIQLKEKVYEFIGDVWSSDGYE